MVRSEVRMKKLKGNFYQSTKSMVGRVSVKHVPRGTVYGIIEVGPSEIRTTCRVNETR